MYASERSERARKFSELYSFTNAISMQLLTISNINHKWYHKIKGRSSFRNNNVLDKNERASNAAENATFIP